MGTKIGLQLKMTTLTLLSLVAVSTGAAYGQSNGQTSIPTNTITVPTMVDAPDSGDVPTLSVPNDDKKLPSQLKPYQKQIDEARKLYKSGPQSAPMMSLDPDTIEAAKIVNESGDAIDKSRAQSDLSTPGLTSQQSEKLMHKADESIETDPDAIAAEKAADNVDPGVAKLFSTAVEPEGKVVKDNK